MKPQTSPIHWSALGALAASLGCWAVAPLFIKYFTGFFDAYTQNFYRYSIAAMFWMPLLVVSIRRGGMDRTIWRLAFWPAMANILMQTCWASSLYYLEPGMHMLVARSTIAFTPLLGFILFPDERRLIRSKGFWIGVVLSSLGAVGVMVFKENFTARGTLIGVGYALGSSFLWGVYSALVRKKLRPKDPRLSFAVISIYTTLGCGLIMLLLGRPGAILNASASTWGLLIISAVLGIGIAHVFYYRAIHGIGVSIAAGLLLSLPFLTGALSWFVFGEVLNSRQWLSGIVLVAGGISLILSHRHMTKV